MKVVCALVLLIVLFIGRLWADEPFQYHLEGDLGIFYDIEQRSETGVNARSYVLPYAYFDYGRFFARIDTFGVKTAPLAYGHIELVGRVSLDGFKGTDSPALKGINDRQDSFPIGLGSFQLTPIGGFFLYALHDVNKSRGNIYEITYAAEADLGDVTVYPEAGVELFSKQYTQYFYGVSMPEAAKSGLNLYSPGSAINPSLGIFVDVPVTGRWHTVLYLRHKWLSSTLSGSPLVSKTFQGSAFIALTSHFK